SEIETILEVFPSHKFQFENLLHVDQFAAKLGNIRAEISIDDLSAIFQDTRPSLYQKWLEKQSPVCTVFLFILWAVQEVNQFVYEEDFERIFNKITEGLLLPPVFGFETHFDEARKILVDQQRVVFRNLQTDFVHPLFKQAVFNFFIAKPSIKR